MKRVIYDSSGLSEAARGNPRARVFLRESPLMALVVVPAIVVAESVRPGGLDPMMDRLLNAVAARVPDERRTEVFPPVTEEIARRAAALMHDTDMGGHTIDALVAAEATMGEGAIIVTQDWEDLSRLTQRHADIRVYRV